VHGAIEDFARELCSGDPRLSRLRKVERRQAPRGSGGLSGNRIAKLAVGRTSVLLKAQGVDIVRVPGDVGGLVTPTRGAALKKSGSAETLEEATASPAILRVG
jgi:hypothetical protein